MDLEKSI